MPLYERGASYEDWLATMRRQYDAQGGDPAGFDAYAQAQLNQMFGLRPTLMRQPGQTAIEGTWNQPNVPISFVQENGVLKPHDPGSFMDSVKDLVTGPLSPVLMALAAGALGAAGAGVGEAGAAGAAGIAPEVGALFSGLDTAALSGAGLTEAGTLGAGLGMNAGAGGTGGLFEFLETVPSQGMPSAVPEADPTFGGVLTQTGSGQFENLGNIESFGGSLTPTGVGGAASTVDALGKLRKLLGGSENKGSDLGNFAFNSAPFLLALAQAERQRGDINDPLGRIKQLEDSINGPEYMNAITRPYDMETASGRTSMTDSLASRGVLGSSFGTMDLNNYDYIRGTGRADIASKALLNAAGLGGELAKTRLGGINNRNLNENALLGAGLNASARLFSPQQDPFNLAMLRSALGGS